MSHLLLTVALALALVAQVAVGSSDPPPPTDTLRQCRRRADPAGCKSFVTKWYYNAFRQICQQFNYGGCSGNNNRFDSEQECMNTCYRVASCPAPDAFPLIHDGCFSNPYTKTDGCDSYYEVCPNAQPPANATPCPVPRPPEMFNAPSDCKVITYKGFDGCLDSVVDCTAQGPATPE